MDLGRLVGVFGLLFVAVILLRVFLVYRKLGYLPVIFGRSDSAHDYVHNVLMAVLALEGINILLFRMQALMDYLYGGHGPVFYNYLGPFHALETPEFRILGLVLCYLGLLWSAISQSQMGKDWRVGIDDKNETSLVTRGLYKISRHPIYLGFMVITVGLFFALANVVSLLCAVMTIVILSIEARLEEEFLLSRHGLIYKDYLARTRRWL